MMEIGGTTLWFAFNLLSLNHWRHPFTRVCIGATVVICFQFTIFEPLETPHAPGWSRRMRLWFAFNLLSLNHWRHRNHFCHERLSRCDLLSIYYLWTIGDTAIALGKVFDSVVICFQFTIFEPLETPGDSTLPQVNSCDLLSIYYLWTIGDTAEVVEDAHAPVVICFQFTIFEPLETPTLYSLSLSQQLWFAFNLLSLNHWRHPFGRLFSLHLCCDLLSIYYLWTIGDTPSAYPKCA